MRELISVCLIIFIFLLVLPWIKSLIYGVLLGNYKMITFKYFKEQYKNQVWMLKLTTIGSFGLVVPRGDSRRKYEIFFSWGIGEGPPYVQLAGDYFIFDLVDYFRFAFFITKEIRKHKNKLTGR